VEEIYDYAQEDLISDDVMLLDAYTEVYVWVGTGANESEKKEAIVTAAEYVKNAPDARSGDTPIILVKQGFEPKLFTVHFAGWSEDKAKVRPPYHTHLCVPVYLSVCLCGVRAPQRTSALLTLPRRLSSCVRGVRLGWSTMRRSRRR
jgi:hypothetical protein